MLVDDESIFVRPGFNVASGSKQRHQRNPQSGCHMHRAAVVGEEDVAVQHDCKKLAQGRSARKVDDAIGKLVADRADERGACGVTEVENAHFRVF